MGVKMTHVRQRRIFDYCNGGAGSHTRSLQRISYDGNLSGRHVEHCGVRRGYAFGPIGGVFAGAYALRRKHHAAANATPRQRHAELGARSERRRHTGHDFNRHAGLLQGVDLLLRAAEQHRVTAFEAHHGVEFGGSVDQTLVDEPLRGRMSAATLADRDFFGSSG